jgi:AcrR family transcriptional regulator
MPKQTFFNLPDEKRDIILGAAVAEFAEKGYKAASISAIVAAAKIAKGSFYQYFEDKDDLYVHIIATKIARPKLAAFEAERHRLEDLNLTEFLRLVFHRQADIFHEEPILINISLDLFKMAHEPVYTKVMRECVPISENVFAPFIKYEIGQGELDPNVNVGMLNFMLMNAWQYFMEIYMELGADAMTHGFVDKLADDLEYILTNGIYLKHVPGR